MAHGRTEHTATKATTDNSVAVIANKQFNGKHLMADAKEAFYFMQRRAAHVLRSTGYFFPYNMMNSRQNRDAWEAIKADTTRLVTCPVFWLVLVLACISCAAASVAVILWVLCTPLLLRNSDFLTWALRENTAKYNGKVAWVTGEPSCMCTPLQHAANPFRFYNLILPWGGPHLPTPLLLHSH